MSVLLFAAISIALIHTATGPDHYLPFIVMAKARKWSLARTSVITILCGLGHVASSIVLGMIGIALGTAVEKLEIFESYRGNLAAWAMIAFGLVYMAWGIRRSVKGKSHSHDHTGGKKDITPWVLFTVFVFGPCEPLIPLLMYPAAKHDVFSVIAVSGVFAAVTIGTMLAIVLAVTFGMRFVRLARLERYSHAMAGGTILASGLAIQFLGL